MSYLSKIINAKYVDEFKIKLSFSDGLEKIPNLDGKLNGPVFEKLKDKNYFKNFSVNSELGTIVWPNGVDIAADSLYFL